MQACPACGSSNPQAARFCNACGTRLEPATDDGGRSGERRVVTMLFCDVRGSTAAAEVLDAEEWTDVMNAAYERLIEPVVRHEGTVARLMGDAILAFFGAPKAHEDDPQRAVMAGLEIVSAIAPFRERLARERGLDVDVRVGINTGSVVVGRVGSDLRQEYTAMGDAVNVAARMEQTAEPGTVQITEDTYRLVSDLFDAEPLGGIELKGKREPVPAYRVRGRLAAPWRVRASRSLETPLVGREAEVGVLRGAIDRARDGVGTVIVVVGEPGIGKSRLVEEANALWAELEPGDDRRWDFWSCVPYDAMQPYAQYRRLIRERAGILGGDPPEVVRAKIAGLRDHIAPEEWREPTERVARALLGVELEDEGHLEGEAFQRAATDLVVDSTRAHGGRRMIVFEDLHWCDRASLELVRATTRLVAEEPYVLLVTLRPDPNAPSWAFKEWLEEELAERTRVVELAPLERAHSERLMEELLPDVAMPERVRRAILEKTEGNPLFVHEVARSLLDAGAVQRGDDGRRLADMDVAIPETVQSLITVGLDRLPERARRTLQTAAVIGRTFEEDVLRAVVPDVDVSEDLRELERRDLVRAVAEAPRPSFTFRHALTQEAAYGSLLVKHRREVHRRVARELEAAARDRLEDVAPVLTHHFAEAGDDEATLRYALVSGDAAARLYANAEAEAHYRTALDVALRTGAEFALLRSTFERRGTALELAGRHQDAVANYEEMRSAARERGDEAMELSANGAIALLYATASPLFDAERGRRLSEENVVTARRLGDRAAEGRALWCVLVSIVYGGETDMERAIEAGEAALAIARELGDREQAAYALNDLGRAYLNGGDFATATERLAEARALWEELDHRPMLGDNLGVSSGMRLLAGDHASAMSESRLALSIAESIGNRWGESIALMGVYRVQLDRGELGAAMVSMKRCGEVGEQGGFAYAGVATHAELARVMAYLGDVERALTLADQALAMAEERLPIAVPVAAAIQAEARIASGDLDGARRSLARVDGPRLPQPDATYVLTFADLARGRLALAEDDPAQAASTADSTLRRLLGSGVEIQVAEALVVLARARIGSGRLDEAERLLADAEERAERLGELLPLWEALALTAEVLERRGAEREASESRRRAREIVERVASGIDDEPLRQSFLAREDVRSLGGT